MKCEQIKDLLLTDYLDQQISDETAEAVNQHLLICHECREYSSIVKNKLIEPFKQFARKEPPEELWIKIKDAINHEEQVDLSADTPNAIDYIKNLLRLLNPGMVLGGVMIMTVLVSSVFFVYQTGKNQSSQISLEVQAKQIEHMAYLVADTADLSEEDNEDYGDVIEEFFLLSKR